MLGTLIAKTVTSSVASTRNEMGLNSVQVPKFGVPFSVSEIRVPLQSKSSFVFIENYVTNLLILMTKRRIIINL
jgi:hypothetical protein